MKCEGCRFQISNSMSGCILVDFGLIGEKPCHYREYEVVIRAMLTGKYNCNGCDNWDWQEIKGEMRYKGKCGECGKDEYIRDNPRNIKVCKHEYVGDYSPGSIDDDGWPCDMWKERKDRADMEQA